MNRLRTMLIGLAFAGVVEGSCSRLVTGQTAAVSRASRPEAVAPKSVEQDEWETVWDELGGFEDARVTRAIWTLIAAPDRTVKLFEERILPVAEADPVKTAAWIADLNSSKYLVRDRAETELRKLGESAAPALREALKKPPSAEVRNRAERLLARAVDKKTTPDRVRASRAIAILERIGSPECLRLLERLAEGSSAARETQLARSAASRLSSRLEPEESQTRSPAAAVNGR